MSGDVNLRIVRRVSSDGHPFTELLFSWMGKDQRMRHSLSRLNYTVPDGPHSTAYQVSEFIKRREKWNVHQAG